MCSMWTWWLCNHHISLAVVVHHACCLGDCTTWFFSSFLLKPRSMQLLAQTSQVEMIILPLHWSISSHMYREFHIVCMSTDCCSDLSSRRPSQTAWEERDGQPWRQLCHCLCGHGCKSYTLYSNSTSVKHCTSACCLDVIKQGFRKVLLAAGITAHIVFPGGYF